MASATAKVPKLDECNCLAVRQAARHITQFYDRFLPDVRLRTTQFSILERLRRNGPMTINALAAEMVMDRTTMGRNVHPLQRDGLITAVTDKTDRRRKTLLLTDAGASAPDRVLSLLERRPGAVSCGIRPRAARGAAPSIACRLYKRPRADPRSNSISWPVALSLYSRPKR